MNMSEFYWALGRHPGSARLVWTFWHAWLLHVSLNFCRSNCKVNGSYQLCQTKLAFSLFLFRYTFLYLQSSDHFLLYFYQIVYFSRSFLSSLTPKMNFEWKRRLEAWKYGAGLDYKLWKTSLRKKQEVGQLYIFCLGHNINIELMYYLASNQ